MTPLGRLGRLWGGESHGFPGSGLFGSNDRLELEPATLGVPLVGENLCIPIEISGAGSYQLGRLRFAPASQLTQYALGRRVGASRHTGHREGSAAFAGRT